MISIPSIFDWLFGPKPKPAYRRPSFASRKKRASRTVKAAMFDLSREHASLQVKCAWAPQDPENHKRFDRMAAITERGIVLRNRLARIEAMTEPKIV